MPALKMPSIYFGIAASISVVQQLAIAATEISETSVSEALALNDECREGDSQCTLNAIQLKSKGLAAVSEMEDSNTTSEAGRPSKWSSHNSQKSHVSCDPMCHQREDVQSGGGDTSQSLGAGPDETGTGTDAVLGRGNYIRHYAWDCWKFCHGSGPCDHFCGHGNACCRYGWKHRDNAVCQHVPFYPILHGHTCVNVVHPQPSSGTGNTGDAGCSNRGRGGQIKTLYHQTGCDIGPLILKNGFNLGSRGWCGGGIYFAESPHATGTKAIGADSHKGFMIEAKVMVGRVGTGDRTCHTGGKALWGSALHNAGYDTMTFNPGDGNEWVVYCSSQVLSTRRIPWKGCR
eukprot:TRINITY_DN40584_c0_g1_i1.p1 TRINITY_DN40584_c0_g1~~TRINITY_DN40584_c0_g1_i1.p1  ORF type:complete len:345 (+),score=52.15 TRINITY_DN40584_c0_g1_i1:78-1112(+)